MARPSKRNEICSKHRIKRSVRRIKTKRNGIVHESYCSMCRHEKYLRHRNSIRNCNLVKRYGITFEQYQQMLIFQNHKCAICDAPNDDKYTFAVDHCHITGKVRGLLCSHCNTALGQLKDSVDIAIKAASYLATEGR